jgi:hypothetical protein
MKRLLLAGMVGIASLNSMAADNSAVAAQIAAQQEADERDRQFLRAIENLQQDNIRQQTTINNLSNENAALRRQLIEIDGRFKNSQIGAVNSQDLKRVYDKMAEMEKAREADKKLIVEQMEKLRELASKPPQTIVITPPPAKPQPREPQPVAHTPAPQPDPTPEPDIPDFAGEYYPYKIKSGDNLTSIIAAYNAELKTKGKAPITLDMVKKANPKLNENRLVVGREIRIPVPADKK